MRRINAESLGSVLRTPKSKLADLSPVGRRSEWEGQCPRMTTLDRGPSTSIAAPLFWYEIDAPPANGVPVTLTCAALAPFVKANRIPPIVVKLALFFTVTVLALASRNLISALSTSRIEPPATLTKKPDTRLFAVKFALLLICTRSPRMLKKL